MRNPDSHKGENGKVCVIGGSRWMHGAPLFSALSTEASGVDLVYVCVPACHEEVAKAQSLNFQVHPFEEDELTRRDVTQILELLAIMDAAVIGPGLARVSATFDAIARIIEGSTCPLVIDASALQPDTLKWCNGKSAVLTPHLGELERMGIPEGEVTQIAKKHGVTIHVKDATDRIVLADGTQREVSGGNAGLTVGGTGDALAGLIAGLMAQGEAAGDACVRASETIKSAGDALYKTHGFASTTRDVIAHIPRLLA